MAKWPMSADTPETGRMQQRAAARVDFMKHTSRMADLRRARALTTVEMES